MDTEPEKCDLNEISADRRLIEQLYAHNQISADAREYALNVIYPHDKWGTWISRILLVIGSSLVLAGIIYFFAFNWARITPAMKFSSLEMGIVICLGGAVFYSLDRLSGKVLLLSACVLIGVFLAVFGQIYQTGADTYQLFMMWSILIFGWVAISQFAPLWIVWLTVTNVFLVLYWQQEVQPSREMESMIFSYVAALNGTFLALKEILSHREVVWLHVRWIRVVLSIVTLVALLIPICMLIWEPERATESICISAALGVLAHVTFFYVYRYRLKDMWTLSAIILSVCIIVEVASFKIFLELFKKYSMMLFLTGSMALLIFSFAVIYLRKTLKSGGFSNA